MILNPSCEGKRAAAPRLTACRQSGRPAHQRFPRLATSSLPSGPNSEVSKCARSWPGRGLPRHRLANASVEARAERRIRTCQANFVDAMRSDCSFQAEDLRLVVWNCLAEDLGDIGELVDVGPDLPLGHPRARLDLAIGPGFPKAAVGMMCSMSALRSEEAWARACIEHELPHGAPAGTMLGRRLDHSCFSTSSSEAFQQAATWTSSHT
jgi:hypothetical protein